VHRGDERQGTWRRLLVTGVAVGAVVIGALAAEAYDDDQRAAVPVPQAPCGPGSRPETDIQGRVPRADYESGRAARGYFCNTRQVGHSGKSGGFKALRYVDRHGRVCAYYDSDPIAPHDILGGILKDGLGVVALDMSDPSHPRRTANLMTPAMIAPHESLLVHQRRGLLVAVMGSAATLPGFVDVYSVRSDCRHPRLLGVVSCPMTTPMLGVGPGQGRFRRTLPRSGEAWRRPSRNGGSSDKPVWLSESSPVSWRCWGVRIAPLRTDVDARGRGISGPMTQ